MHVLMSLHAPSLPCPCCAHTTTCSCGYDQSKRDRNSCGDNKLCSTCSMLIPDRSADMHAYAFKESLAASRLNNAGSLLQPPEVGIYILWQHADYSLE